MKRITLVALAAALTLALPSPSHAALNAYLKLTGETQGEIRGDVTQVGREDSILIVGFAHEVVSPRDRQSGMPTGVRQHQPVVLIKEVDRASPLLHHAQSAGENITEWRIDFWRPSPSGQEVQFYSIELVNARVVSIKTEMLDTHDPENLRVPVREHVAFTYEKIIWTFQNGGITSEDDWDQPKTK